MKKSAVISLLSTATQGATQSATHAATPSPSILHSPLSPPLLLNTRGGWQRPNDGPYEKTYSSSSSTSSPKSYYKTLNVPSTASQKEITKAYRRLCVKHHPDKTGGARAKFDEISKAYETLHDPKKRKLYDQLGEGYDDPNRNPFGQTGNNPFEGMGGFGGMNGMSQEDILRNIFAGQGGFGQQRRPMKHGNVEYNLGIELRDLYGGCVKKVTIAKPVSSRQTEKCTLKVEIGRGMQEGDEVRVEGEVSYYKGVSPGDVIFRIVESNKGSGFERRNNDLMVSVTISLTESLKGFTKKIKHLDDRIVTITRNGQVKNGEWIVVEDEGMPVYGGRGFGRLFVKVNVKAPKVAEKSREELAEFLGESVDEIEEGEGVKRGRLGKEEEFGKDKRGVRPRKEEEQEQDRGFGGGFEDGFFDYRGNGFGPREGSNVQCAQM
ncbi:hypothetical protein TrVE_jg11687 [Triparma verrucosa]|uniref:J domain-containing protein n=1 Tax=Triparma verrucosa TaxID=1606542 RepID=A0A9W7EVB6_9STRA|nr:hypothetical protein TrVE_jg11687 [Triparma verrucosa]